MGFISHLMYLVRYLVHSAILSVPRVNDCDVNFKSDQIFIKSYSKHIKPQVFLTP